ncbi:hypothetical protein CPC08DRAFT_480549 [Agrocybe pediades]|nr:hypothetical protein CPC08DRAFT_480549 [Agrocybe pediades]
MYHIFPVFAHFLLSESSDTSSCMIPWSTRLLTQSPVDSCIIVFFLPSFAFLSSVFLTRAHLPGSSIFLLHL